MKILWVEDDVSKEKVLEYFKIYLTEGEFKELEEFDDDDFADIKDFLKDDIINKIFISSYLNDAINIIKNNPPFDKIILDIKLPIKPVHVKKKFNLSEELKDSFFGDDYNKFIEIISEDKYSGIILNHLIVEYYKDKYRWNRKDIISNIAFLSSNNINVQNFEKGVTEIYKQSFRYDSDGARIQFFNKNKKDDEEKFINWLKTDKYTLILENYLPSAINNLLELSKNKDSKDPTIIKGNLVHLRQLLEGIAKSVSTTKNMASFILSLNKITPKDRFLFAKKRELSLILKEIDPNFKLKLADEKATYMMKVSAIKNLATDKNYKSINLPENIRYGEIKYNNRFNKKLNIDEQIYTYFKYSWKVLSELIHDDNNLTKDGETFTTNTDKANNIINILFYQFKELIIWFGSVMEKIEK